VAIRLVDIIYASLKLNHFILLLYLLNLFLFLMPSLEQVPQGLGVIIQPNGLSGK